MAVFDLIRLYQETFGYKGIPYNRLSTEIKVPRAQGFDDLPVYGDFVVEQKSLLDTPLFLPLKLNGIQLPNEPLIDISMCKKNIMTDIDGNDGSFKENFTNGDYKITIRGIATNDEVDDLPEAFIRQLRTIIEDRKSVPAVNRLLSLFNIQYLSIGDIQLPRVPGEIAMQGYELVCLSDKVFELELKKGGL
jgi:hypothetical protein